MGISGCQNTKIDIDKDKKTEMLPLHMFVL